MASLRVKVIGMSFLIEGLISDSVDGDRLGRELFARYGIAAAVIGRNAEPPTDVSALLVDRRAESWDGLQAWLESRIREQGFSSTRWEEFDVGRSAALHLEAES